MYLYRKKKGKEEENVIFFSHNIINRDNKIKVGLECKYSLLISIM